MIKELPGIYKIINKLNNKFYIGSAVNLSLRWCQHKYLLKLNKHNNSHLQRAWNKYGEENFEFQVLEYCEKNETLDKEQRWIDITDACAFGYNQRKIAESNLGIKWTDSHKLKISVSKKGKNQPKDAVKLRAELNTGKKRTSETKIKMSLSIKSYWEKRKIKELENLNINSQVEIKPTIDVKERKKK